VTVQLIEIILVQPGVLNIIKCIKITERKLDLISYPKEGATADVVATKLSLTFHAKSFLELKNPQNSKFPMLLSKFRQKCTICTAQYIKFLTFFCAGGERGSGGTKFSQILQKLSAKVLPKYWQNFMRQNFNKPQH